MAAGKKNHLLTHRSYYLSGNEAIVEAALEVGCRYYAGYPITPSSEIMEMMSVRLPEVGGVFIQMEDEIASICSVIGASWAGAKAMTATSGPGFDLMQEGIGYSVITETPIVVVDVQRAGPGTGQATRVGSGDLMQAKWGSHGDYLNIVVSPWSVQEAYDLTIKAFNFAETYRTPVIVLSEEAVGHLRERIDFKGNIEIVDRKKNPGAAPFGTEEVDGIPPMPSFGEGEKLLVTGSTHDEYGYRKTDDAIVQEKLTSRIINKVFNNRDKIIEYQTYYLDDAELVIAANGFTARSALYAIEYLRSEGKKIGMFRFITIWPFPDKVIKKIGNQTKKIFVPEMNRGQLAGEIMKYAHGDILSYGQNNGEIIEPHVIIEQLRRFI